MPRRPTALTSALRRPALAVVLATMLAVAAAPSFGAPDSGASVGGAEPDAVSRFLADKGLIPAGAVSALVDRAFIDKMRERASEMVLTALNFLDVPYRRAGSTAEHGFDCSGFTRHVFQTSLGLLLPRSADEQAHAKGLVNVPREELQPGDLVFFNTLRRTFSHVGIYLGDDKFIHSPRTGSEVRVESMRFAYWAQRFTGARRLDAVVDAPAATPPAAAGFPGPR